MIEFDRYNAGEEISDELLAAYLDGNTSPAESSLVKSAIQWDDSLAETLDIASDSQLAEDGGLAIDWYREEIDAIRQGMDSNLLSTDNFFYGDETDFFKLPDNNESSLDDWLSNDYASFNQYDDVLDSCDGDSSLESSDDVWNDDDIINNTEQTDMDYDRF